MNYVMAYAPLVIMALGGVLTIVIGMGAVLSWTRYLMFAFVACMLILASSSGYGLEDATEANVFWVKGTRTLFFSFVEMGMLGAWLALLFRNAWSWQRTPMLPISKYYLAFGVLLLGWFIVGLLNEDKRHVWLFDVSQRGFTNLLFQGMFISLLVATLTTAADLRRLALLMVACLFCRHLFGLVRFAAFGGDPQNAYDTLGGSHVRITFWDINDSVLAAAAFVYCAWRVITERKLGPSTRWFLMLASAAALLIPLLSARRSAQGGMLLALAALVALLPKGRRLAAVAALVLAVPLVLLVLGQRSDNPRASLVDRLLIDVKTDRLADPRSGRFHELRTAWDSIGKSPLFGLGPSGSFKVIDHRGLEYHGGRYDYVHSGFGHVLLKTGIVGLALYGALLLSWVMLVVRLWPATAGPARALAAAGVAGCVAMVPTLLFGTPIVEIRTMLVLGFLMALPILAARVGPQWAAEPVRRPMAFGIKPMPVPASAAR